MRWNLGNKLYATVGAMVLLACVMAAFGTNAVLRVKDDGDRVIEAGAEHARAVEIGGLVDDADGNTQTLILAASLGNSDVVKTKTEEVRAHIIEAGALVAEMEKNAKDPHLQQLEAALKEALGAWKGGFERIAAAAGRGEAAVAKSDYETVRLDAEKTMAASKAVEDAQEAAVAALEQSSEATFGSARNTQIAFCVVALLIGIAAFFLVRAAVKTLSTVATELKLSSSEVASASGHVATTAQSLSQGAISQAASIEETSASMEEMASMTRQNAENSAEAAKLMAEASVAVDRSNMVLGEMVESMSAIRESSDKVSRIIKTIDEIAFQTNILALNAAVEAARAGEAGMGFAVVADEVRSLAQRSAQAARDTAVLIEEASTNAAKGGERVVHVEQAIRGITDSVTRVKTLVDQVSDASREQSQGIDQVSQAISRMENVTQTTAASAEESAAASEELSAQAESVLSSVSTLERLVAGSGEREVSAPRFTAPAQRAKPGKPQASRPGGAVRKPGIGLSTGTSTGTSSGAEMIPFDDDGGFVPFESGGNHRKRNAA
ncbi:MAG: methyl-accepting chemotaxis protein [Candidatus Eisenbacteria bacterium]